MFVRRSRTHQVRRSFLSARGVPRSRGYQPVDDGLLTDAPLSDVWRAPGADRSSHSLTPDDPRLPQATPTSPVRRDQNDNRSAKAVARTLGAAVLVGLSVVVYLAATQAAHGQDAPCVNIYHDETKENGGEAGPINAIMLANLLGHWPHYEVRVRPIKAYRSADLEACKATLHLATRSDAEIPNRFLADFFETKRNIVWIGFGVHQLDATRFLRTFRHLVSGEVSIEDSKAVKPRYYQYVSYKGALFRKNVHTANGQHEGAFSAVRFVPVGDDARKAVLAELIHSETKHSIPYFLRADNKFIIGDIPFAYMHEGDRYFAFADLLFDILDEQPLRQIPLAFARTEDIHGFYDRGLLRAAFSALRAEDVPISIAHIPLFMDPFNAFGRGDKKKPVAANLVPGFTDLIADIAKDKRNVVAWHGTTHQFGLSKNPHSGTSGDDYEFWDMVANKPVRGDGVPFTLDRLGEGLRVFEAYGIAPRYWVPPHYHASAINSRVFGAVFPWVVGRVTYYTSSMKPTFTLKAVDSKTGVAMPSVSQQQLADLKKKDWVNLDARSEGALTQMFPFEIYRDVYGQRIIPETLGYLSFATSDQTDFIRLPEHMLADAQRNLVVRDYWASFFFHPYLFAPRDDGGVGRQHGDTIELRKLLVGLKLLGYQFVGLPDFETQAAQQAEARATLRSRP